MSEFSLWDGARIFGKGIRNYVEHKPLIVSYEVTLSCNCNCRHCDLGGLLKDEQRMTPEQYSAYTARFKPPLVQISGGEPLLRHDLTDIVHAVKHAHEPTYVIVVTNGALLDEDIYVRLKQAGMNQLSVSLDFPDDRHDDFRRHKGLFNHLDATLPRLAALRHGDIIMNTAITSANLGELIPIADLVEQWGVTISYSAYTPLRTGDPQYSIRTEDDMRQLRDTFEELMQLARRKKHIANPDTIFKDTLDYFKNGGMPNCHAGERFFVVMPDGALVPCSLHRHRFTNQEDMSREFTAHNTCGACYVSIRSYSDKPLGKIVVQDVPSLAKRLFDRFIPEGAGD